MGKSKIIYSEKFNKGTEIDLSAVTKLIDENKESISVEILERGKMDDSSEFITVKLIIHGK